jgi:hypothetical protein
MTEGTTTYERLHSHLCRATTDENEAGTHMTGDKYPRDEYCRRYRQGRRSDVAMCRAILETLAEDVAALRRDLAVDRQQQREQKQEQPR